MNSQSNVNCVEQLCPKCGLCCNGVLFVDVELQKGDDAKRLREFGLSVEKKGRSKQVFPQPCGCFDGKFCTIYADRPARCRAFECGLLKRVKAGKLDSSIALKEIAKVRSMVKRVQKLLTELGQQDENLALVKRYSEIMNSPIDFSKGSRDSDKRGKLMLAMHELMEFLQREFLA